MNDLGNLGIAEMWNVEMMNASNQGCDESDSGKWLAGLDRELLLLLCIQWDRKHSISIVLPPDLLSDLDDPSPCLRKYAVINLIH
jgi:hypothetical protein